MTTDFARSPSQLSSASPERVVHVEHLSVTYRDVAAVADVSFDVQTGEAFGLVGESGSGKSSIARALMRLVDADGSVTFDGIDWLAQRGAALRRLRPRIQMVFQDPFASLDPRMSVRAIVAEPLDIHSIGSRNERRAQTEELLSLVGIGAGQLDRNPSALSGGQRQRVAIARALALRPKLVVLDEPISALDVSIQAQVLNLLADLRGRLGLTYIFIAHDLVIAEYFCDRLAVMLGGRMVETGSSAAIFREPAHPYTQELLAAVPIPDPTRRRVARPAADASTQVSAKRGCPYQARCQLRKGRPLCAEETPPLRPIAPSHAVACHFIEEATEGTVPPQRDRRGPGL